jgi:hypothetical protein
MNRHLETIRNIAFSMEGLAAAFRMTGNQMLADKMDTYASVLLNAKAEIELELAYAIEASFFDDAIKEMDTAQKFSALVGAAFRSGIS